MANGPCSPSNHRHRARAGIDPRRLVDHGRRLGDDDRVAERVRQDAVPDLLAGHPVDERAEQRDGLEGWPGAVRSISVRWSLSQADSKTGSSPAAAHASSRAVQVTRCGEVLKPSRMGTCRRQPAGTVSRANPRLARIRCPLITAPSDAEDTSAAYFARTPDV